MKFFSKQSLFLFLIFYGIVFFLYRHCLHVGFIDDSLAAFWQYKQQGTKGFFNSFNFPALYYGHDLFYFLPYFLFGLNEVVWHLLFFALFSLNALFIFHVSKNVLEKYSFSRSFAAAFIACLFFIFHPHQTENVLWFATMHYQIAMLCLLAGILLIIHNKSIWVLHALFILSLLTIEITLVFPAIWATTFLVFRKDISETFKKIILPQAFAIAVYFLATKFLKGSFIPHYGTEHLQGWSPLVMLSVFTKYLLKILGFVHFASYETREKIYNWCDSTIHILPVWISVAVFFFILLKTKFTREAKFVLALLGFSFIALLPVLNMYFMFLMQIENDRLSFFALPFLSLLTAFLLTRIPVVVTVPVTVFALVVMKKFLGLYCWYWINASEVQTKTLESYRWFDKKKVYVLNLPQNFGGAYIYRRPWRFACAMGLCKDKNIEQQIEVVAGQNMFNASDGVTVEKTDSLLCKITLEGWGWFWNEQVGAYDYETEDFRFKLIDKTYSLHFKHPLQNDEAIIFQHGGIWQELKP